MSDRANGTDRDQPAFDVDLKAGFDRYAREMFGWQKEMPHTLAPAAMIFQLFCLLIWQNDARDSSTDSAGNDPRKPALLAFMDKLFALTESTHPHMLITRGLSLLNYLKAPPIEQPALELGCESGLTSRLLFDTPFRYGIDITPDWADAVRESGMHQEYRVGSADAIPLPDESVQSIVMNNVLYHVANRKQALQEVFRCLRPGGRAYFDDLAPAFFDESNRPFLAFLRDSGGRNFVREYSRKRYALYLEGRTINPYEALGAAEYPSFMKSVGFTNINVHYFHCRELLRLAYNFLDMGFIFGIGPISSKTPAYKSLTETRLLTEILRDTDKCVADGEGGYVFATATKP